MFRVDRHSCRRWRCVYRGCAKERYKPAPSIFRCGPAELDPTDGVGDADARRWYLSPFERDSVSIDTVMINHSISESRSIQSGDAIQKIVTDVLRIELKYAERSIGRS